jgi:4a-hydroxytetrahydrobiopterin dehydratase
MTNTDQWNEEGGKLVRTFAFESYIEAIRFVYLSAGISESLEHHPEIFVDYTSVTLSMHTKDEDGAITDLDHKLATEFNDLYGDFTDPS